jgi:hypothetical protein
MKILNLKLRTILLISLGLIVSCGEDKEKVSLFVGDYVITEAKVAEPFDVPLTGFVFTVQVGTPITAAIQKALLSAVDCSSPDKSYVELREDFSLFMSCEGANPLRAGTWTELSSTELLLNLNDKAVPSAIALTVSDVVKSGGILTGNTSVPLPKAMIEAMLAAFNPDLILDASAPPVFVVKFTLKFTQK